MNKEIAFAVNREDANFDRACDAARLEASTLFVDDDNSLISISFKDYSEYEDWEGNWNHTYTFVARVQ